MPLPGIAGQVSLLGYVRERAIAVVVVEDVLSPIGDEKVVVAVVIVVADANRIGPAGMHQARIPGHVGKGAVPVVLVQAIAWLFALFEAFQARAVGQEDVQPPVVVVVVEGNAASIRFHDVLNGADASVYRRFLEPGGLRDIDKGDRIAPARRGYRRGQKREGPPQQRSSSEVHAHEFYTSPAGSKRVSLGEPSLPNPYSNGGVLRTKISMGMAVDFPRNALTASPAVIV